jgi:PAS domain S-box-containing protein
MSIQTDATTDVPAVSNCILELGALAAREADLDRLFEAVTRIVSTSLAVDGCHIYKSGSTFLELIAGARGNVEQHARHFALQALERHTTDSVTRGQAWSLLLGDQSMSGLAIVIDGDSAPFGVLVILRQAPGTFSKVDVDFTKCLAAAISESLRKAHSLRDRARLDSVVTATSEAVAGFTNDGRIFSWNESAVHLFGYTSDEAIGQPLNMLFVPGATPSDLHDWSRANTSAVETVLKGSNGATIEVEVTIAPIVHGDGHVTAASMMVRDIRDKRRSYRALQMHGDILAHMPSAVIVWQLEKADDPFSLRLVLGNPAADALAGYSLTDRAGTAISDVSLGVGEHPDAETYASVARLGIGRDFGDIRLERGDGSHRCYHVQAFPLPERSVGVVFHDVTEQRDLAESLQHAQRMEVIGRLAAGFAHDFNNQLTVIRGYSELLGPAVSSNERGMNDVREIERACESAHQLTRQLLAFGRRQILRPTTLDLSATVRSAHQMLRRIIGEDIKLIVPDQTRVAVVADAGQVEQVLLNLAINSRDAMPAGGTLFIDSSVAIVAADAPARAGGIPPGAFGVLQVTDTGIGMDPDTLERIFEPFFTTKDPGRGTGLGLSTVYGIVKQSGGHITVESTPGVGTTFKVYFPAANAWDAVTVPNQQPGEAIAPARRSSGSQTVLLVEDDDAVRTLVKEVLSQAGYTVLAAAAPDEALTLAGRFTGPIDLLLTDVMMPVQSGPELAARLVISFPGLQVLYMSGHLQEVAGHRMLPSGAAFMSKPFRPGDLLIAIQRVLESTEQVVEFAEIQAVM